LVSEPVRSVGMIGRYNYWERPKIFFPKSSRPHSGASSQLSNRNQGLFPQKYNCRSVKPTTQPRQVLRLRWHGAIYPLLHTPWRTQEQFTVRYLYS